MPDARGRGDRAWRKVARTIVPRSIRVGLGRRSNRERAREKRPWDMGRLRRTTPVSSWGADRGGSIDRVYIERFLEQHRADIRGRVLEVQDDNYTRRYGVRVEQVEILDARPGNPKATVVADLTDAPELASDAFDCVILTQTLFLVYDVQAALRTVQRDSCPGRGIARDGPRNLQDLTARSRPLRGLVAFHVLLGAAAHRGGVRRGKRRCGDIRERSLRDSVPVRSRNVGSQPRRARRPRPPV